MKARWFAIGLVVGLAGALTLGFGFASAAPDPTEDQVGRAATPGWLEQMDAMHDSSAMQRMHEQMPEEAQAQCDAMHEQMDQMMGQGTMGPGMMGSGAIHAAHHPDVSGTAASPGAGMMGGFGGMMGT